MSWEAVAWANKQKMKKSYEQIILLVLANSADPDGEAFSKWPFKDHWWVYLSNHTRLSRASVFRHLKTITALGLGERSMLVLADGSKRPTIKLNLASSFDIDNPADRARYDSVMSGESPIETDDEHDTDEHENNNNINESQTETPTESNESPIETQESSLRPETQPVSVQRLHKDSNLIPLDSPLPPSGGVSAHDAQWDEFVRVWVDPIPKLELTRAMWDRLPTERLGEAITSARGHRAWHKAQARPPAKQSAQSFLKAPSGFAQWLPFAPTDDGTSGATLGAFRLSTPEGAAIVWLYTIAGLNEFLRRAMIRNGEVNYYRPVGPRLRTLADCEREGWVTLTHQQACAWESFLRETIPVQTRKPFREGARAPKPWPPLAGGGWPATAPPTVPEMTDEDAADFR